MRYGSTGGWTAALTALVALAGPAAAQPAQTYDVPGRPAYTQIPNPLPTGNPGGHGFYTFGEALFLTQTRTLGDQTIAVRGLLDSTGIITGTPGTLIGSGFPALSTKDFPRQSWQPGFNIGAGVKLEDGTSIHFSYARLVSNTYHAGATLVPPFFRGSSDLSDTFLTAPVYNFPPQYAGPRYKTNFDDTNGDGTFDSLEGGNFYGIWNGASVMDIRFDQWYQSSELGVTVPLFQTEYSRIYGLAGGRYTNFTDRFKWRTVSYDVTGGQAVFSGQGGALGGGQGGPRDAAEYNNTLTQRMYGAYVGCGHEAYLGHGFAAALDLTAAGYIDSEKERAKYKLQSEEIQNKQSRNELRFVPSLTANLNLMWYPVEGVQMRLGYNAYTYFNTKRIEDPVGFNYSSPDPVYDIQVFRIVHGVNVGIGLFF